MIAAKGKGARSGIDGDVAGGVGDDRVGGGNMKTSLGIAGANTDVTVVFDKEGLIVPSDSHSSSMRTAVDADGKAIVETFETGGGSVAFGC